MHGQCHRHAQTLDTITPAFRPEDNWDGNPSTKPKEEVALIAARLYAAIQAYCAAAANSALAAVGRELLRLQRRAYPYWYKDTNRNGAVDAGETAAMKFDSKSLRAAYNYQYYSEGARRMGPQQQVHRPDPLRLDRRTWAAT